MKLRGKTIASDSEEIFSGNRPDKQCGSNVHDLSGAGAFFCMCAGIAGEKSEDIIVVTFWFFCVETKEHNYSLFWEKLIAVKR
jgi:hypothetical protein